MNINMIKIRSLHRNIALIFSILSQIRLLDMAVILIATGPHKRGIWMVIYHKKQCIIYQYEWHWANVIL